MSEQGNKPAVYRRAFLTRVEAERWADSYSVAGKYTAHVWDDSQFFQVSIFKADTESQEDTDE